MQPCFQVNIFMGYRSLHELKRKKLVPIFLYDNNMVPNKPCPSVHLFDDVSQSRVMISIKYDELTFGPGRIICLNSSNMMLSGQQPMQNHSSTQQKGTSSVLKRELPRETNLDDFARTLVTQWEIKNVLKTGPLLASRCGEGMKREHIKLVLKVTHHIDLKRGRLRSKPFFD
jgi:hypothetical protein